MALKYKIEADAYEKLNEEQQAFYSEKDGNYVLDVEGAEGEDEIQGLKKALQQEREAAKEAARKLKATQDANAGIDKEKYEELLQKEREAEEAAALKAGEFEKLKEQMVTQHQEQMSAKDNEIKRLQGQLEHVQIDSKVVEAISKAGGNVELLKPHVRSRLQLNTEDFTTVVLDQDGSTPKVDADGNPVTIDTLISEMRKSDTYAGAFKATDQSGSGSEPGQGGSSEGGSGAGGTPKLRTEGLKRSEMTDRQKVDYQQEHGLDALLELPE